MDEATLQLLDHNMAMASQAYLATSELGDVAEDRRVWLWCCGLPAPDFNMVFPKMPVNDLDAVIERAEAFFGARSLPWRLTLRAEHARLHEAALSERGFDEVSRPPAMILAAEPTARRKPPPELELREVESAEDLATFCATAFLGFGLPAALGPKFVTADFAARPGARLCLGRVGGEPVCTAACVVTGDWTGVYWVATLEKQRGRGFGEAATWAAIDAGRRLGGSRACLQATPLGRPVYERMGFRTATEYPAFERAEPGGGSG